MPWDWQSSGKPRNGIDARRAEPLQRIFDDFYQFYQGKVLRTVDAGDLAALPDGEAGQIFFKDGEIIYRPTTDGAFVALGSGTVNEVSDLGGGNVSDAEFDYLDGVTSAIQTQLNAKIENETRYVSFVLVAGGSDVSAETDVADLEWECPFSGTIQNVGAYTKTAGVTGTMTVDIHKGGSTIMTTNKITIDSNEKSSRTAATAPSLTTTAVSAGDLFTFDVDAIHSGTAAQGLTVWMEIQD